MEQRDDNQVDKQLEELQALLVQFLGEKGKNLNVIQDLQNLQHALFQREARRLETKLPADDARRKRIDARAKASAAISQGIAEQFALARVTTPDLAVDDALIQGRVVDEKRRGLQQVTVVLEDANGSAIGDLEAVETQPGGYFALKATPDLIAKAQKTEGGVFLTVRNLYGEVVQRVAEPIALEEGIQTFVDVPVKRADVSRVPTTPPPTKPRERADTWMVRGKVTDAAGKGVEGLMVTALDKEKEVDNYLGAALTASNGSFVVAYDVPKFKEGREQGPDLFVRVVDARGQVLFSSEDDVRTGANRDEVFEIVLDRPDKKAQPKKK
jgi:hypothetical protein